MDKIYIWKVDVKEWKYWELVSISFWPQDFDKFENLKNQNWWITLNLKDKKGGGKYLEVFVREKPQETKYNNKDIPF